MFGLFDKATDANAPVSPETIKARRALARKLLESGSSTAPVDHWMQGVARLGQAVQGAVEDHYATRAERSGMESAKALDASNPLFGSLGAGEEAKLPSLAASPTAGNGSIAGIDDRYTPDEARKELSLWDGTGRPETFSGMNPTFAVRKAAFLEDNPYEGSIAINSGFRSPDHQAKLWNEALAKYGSPEAARKWVAPPGRSQHNHGTAADLGFDDPRARDWAHQNAARYGLAFPMAHEPWHVELAGARGAKPEAGGHDHGAPVQVAQAGNGPVPLPPPRPSSGAFLADRQATTDEARAAGPVSAPTSPAPAAPAQAAQNGPNSRAMLTWAQKVLANPWSTPGQKTMAQAMIQKAVTQEVKDPRDGVIKDLTIEEKRRGLNATDMDRVQGPDGQIYERKKGTADAWRPTLKLNDAPEKRTSDMQELDQINVERQRGGLPPLRLDEWKVQKGKANAPAVNLDQRQESEFGKETGKALAKRFDTLATDGDEAVGNLEMVAELRRMGGKIGTGMGAVFTKRMSDWGIKLDGADQVEAYSALIDRLTPQQRVPGAGATSDFDAKMYKGSLPTLMNSPGGNELILGTMERLQHNKIARGDVAMRVQMGELTPKEGIAEIRKLQAEARALSDRFAPPKGETAPPDRQKTKSGVTWSVE